MAMADETTERNKNPERKPGAAGGAPALADEGDVAFGGMAGIGVLAAIIISMLGLAGFFGYTASDDDDHVAATTTTVHEEEDEEADHEEEEEEAAPEPEPEPEPEPVGGTVDAFAQASADSIILSGIVPSEAVADEVRSAAAAVYAPEQIDDQLEIDETADSFTLTATGDVGSQEDLDALVGGFGAIEGVTFDNQLGVDEGAALAEELNALFALEPIQFESGTDVIIPASQPTLDEAATILTAYPDETIEVGGHTDSLGDDAANQALSEARAQRVVTELQARGVETTLIPVGYGETQLKEDPDDTPEKQQANRRIEFKPVEG